MERIMPSAGVTAFRVRTKGVKEFRRAGILFNETWQSVDAAKLSTDQQIELLNTRTLEVEELAVTADVPPPANAPSAGEPERKGKAGK